MNQRIAILFRLLLVAIMVIQPLQSAFAMSGMASSKEVSAVSSPTSSQDIDASCIYHLADGDMFSAHSGDGDHHTAMDDCCSTPACHAVGILSFVPSLQPVIVHFSPLFETPMRGITLPAERKPPRAFHA